MVLFLAMKKNPFLIRLIEELKKASEENGAKIWKDIADRLEKSSRRWPEVNIGKIHKCVNEGEIALVPGKVLGIGKIEKATVAAWKFSDKAREKIINNGGKCYSISKLMEENPNGKNIRIIG